MKYYAFLLLILLVGCSHIESPKIANMEEMKTRGPASRKDGFFQYVDVMKSCHHEFPCRIDLPGNSIMISGNIDSSRGINTFTIDSQAPLAALVTLEDPIRFGYAGTNKLKAVSMPIRNQLKFYNSIDSEDILKIDGTPFTEGGLIGFWVKSKMD